MCAVRKRPPNSTLGHAVITTPALSDTAAAPTPSPTPATAPSGAPIKLHPTWNRPMAPKDLAQFLRVSPTTLRRMAQAGMLPAGIPVGGSVRYMPEEVINHLRQRKPRK